MRSTWQRNVPSQDGQQNLVFVLVSNGLAGKACCANPSVTAGVVPELSAAAGLVGAGVQYQQRTPFASPATRVGDCCKLALSLLVFASPDSKTVILFFFVNPLFRGRSRSTSPCQYLGLFQQVPVVVGRLLRAHCAILKPTGCYSTLSQQRPGE
jgi:hypothetical protein